MRNINRRAHKFGQKAPLGCFLFPVFFILLGLFAHFPIGSSPLEAICRSLFEVNIYDFYFVGFGCVFIFLLLILSSFFLIAPVFAAIFNIVFGYFISTGWGFFVTSAGGDISFLHIVCGSLFSVFVTAAFVAFTQIELVFYSSVASAMHRDRCLWSRLSRLLVFAVICTVLLLALIMLFGVFIST